MKLRNHDPTTHVHPDAMYTVTNVITMLVALLSKHVNVKTVLLEEEDFGRSEWCSAAPLEHSKNTSVTCELHVHL